MMALHGEEEGKRRGPPYPLALILSPRKWSTCPGSPSVSLPSVVLFTRKMVVPLLATVCERWF